MKPSALSSSLFLCAVFLQPTFAQSIGLNFGAGRPDADLAETDSAGVVPQTSWNNLAGGTGGSVVLNDSGATATSASVSWATNEQWSIAETAADPNGRLFKGFISDNNNGGTDSTITITGIPYVTYNLYVYVNHDRVLEDVIISEANGAFPDFTAIENDTAIDVAPVEFVRQTTTGGAPGNYVIFAGLTNSSLDLILKAVDIGGATEGSLARNAIAAIQIVEVVAGDLDGDGLDDNWETLNGLDPNDNGLDPNNNGEAGNPDNGADGDPDEDGSPNSREETQMTDPNNEDSDGDTLLDGVEDGGGVYMSVEMTGTSPLSRDSDEDGLDDNVEDNGGVVVDPVTTTGTDPNDPDSDDDTLRDDWEVANMFDPQDDGSGLVENGPAGNPDDDGSDNADEQERGTDPRDEDTDDDSLLDGVETDDGNFVDETATGTDPLDADTDGDFLSDGVEDNGGSFVDANQTGTDPTNKDTDGDGLRDDFEIAQGGDPFDTGDVVLNDGAIALNFGAGRANASLLATDIAGVFAQANWNNIIGGTGGPLALLDDFGSDIGASATWEFDEQWSEAGPAFDANGVMFTGWVSANAGANSDTVDITGIPYGIYDLVIYFNHNRGNDDVVISEANGAFPTFIAEENDPDINAEITFAQQVFSEADEPSERGNFVIFQGLSGAALNIELASGTASGDRGAITGLQIVNRARAELKITDITVDADAGEATITWDSLVGRLYSVDFATDLSDQTNWQELEDGIEAIGGGTSYTESGIDFSGTTKRFYRVRLLPAE